LSLTPLNNKKNKMEIIYQRIFEYTPDALLMVDQAGRITLANA